jgi:hypothetical protein
MMNQMWVEVFEAVQVAIWLLLAHLDPPCFSNGQGVIWALLLYREYLGFCLVDLIFAMGGGWMGCAQKHQCFLSVFQRKCVNNKWKLHTRYEDASARIGRLVGTIHRFGDLSTKALILTDTG